MYVNVAKSKVFFKGKENPRLYGVHLPWPLDCVQLHLTAAPQDDEGGLILTPQLTEAEVAWFIGATVRDLERFAEAAEKRFRETRFGGLL